SLTKGLSIIIDICDEIRYSKIEKEDIDQKILKVIHDLIESDSLNSLMGDEEKETLNRFFKDFLKLCSDSGKYYFKNKLYNELSFDEFYNVLIQLKYIKSIELSNGNKLPING